MSAPHTNGSAQAARKVPARKKKPRVDHGGIDAPSGEKISYVQWMRDPAVKYLTDADAYSEDLFSRSAAEE